MPVELPSTSIVSIAGRIQSGVIANINRMGMILFIMVLKILGYGC